MEKDKYREKNEALILHIVQQTNGLLCSLDEAVSKLIYIDKKQKLRMPWNCDLTIGSKFAIKTSAIIYVRIYSKLKLWRT